MSWEVLKSPFEIRSFLGLAGYYRRFIRDFSKIVVPLTRLTRKGVVFSWGPEQQASFETLRQRLCEALVLTLPEGMEDFVVYCDASITGLWRGVDAKGACDRVRIEAAEASRGKVSHPRSRVGGCGVRPQDLAPLSVWGSVYDIHGPQEFEVFDGSAKPEHVSEEMVGCSKGL